MRRWPERVEGMTTSKRAQRRKPETDQDGPEATTQQYSGGQSVHREMEFEGHDVTDRDNLTLRARLFSGWFLKFFPASAVG